jgi:hypothetical protein
MIEAINTAKPNNNTAIVFAPMPFHSFKIIPQMLEAMTLSDMRMLHENA